MALAMPSGVELDVQVLDVEEQAVLRDITGFRDRLRGARVVVVVIVSLTGSSGRGHHARRRPGG